MIKLHKPEARQLLRENRAPIHRGLRLLFNVLEEEGEQFVANLIPGTWFDGKGKSNFEEEFRKRTTDFLEWLENLEDE